MRIEGLKAESLPNIARVAATVVWEDCDRPSREIYFETPAQFASDLTCNPHAFLVGCLMPAMHHGEGRIAIDAEICPEFRNGMVTAMGWISHWYGAPRKPVRLEAKVRTRLPSPRTPERAGSFLSGGVDSLATVRANRLDFPLDHPRSIQDGILVHGFDMGASPTGEKHVEAFERAQNSLQTVAQDANLTLIPVHTNIRHLDADVHFWMYEFHGAALASVAHVLARRLTLLYVAASSDTTDLLPFGSHPVLDPNYGSADLEIRYDGTRFTRLDKVRLVADWEAGLKTLRVCTANVPGMLNCGKCDKCLRTMTELLAAGKLASAPTFPVHDLSAEMLQAVELCDVEEMAFYQECVAPLAAQGRLDLIGVIEAKIKEYQKREMWTQERDWKGAVKRFDRRYLNSSLFRFYKAVRTGVKNTLASEPVRRQ